MTNNDFFRICPNRSEQVWGIRYLLFQTVFLSSVLYTATALLPMELNITQLNFLYFCINFVAVLVIFRKFLPRFLQPDRNGIGRVALWSVVFFGVYWLVTTALGKLFSLLDPGFFNANDQTIAGMTRESYSLMFIGTVLLVPITEECLYRGLLFRALYDRSRLLAWAVSAAVFSLVHIVGYIGQVSPLTFLLCFVQYLPAGLCLAGAYRLSGSLLSPILIHAAVNAMGMLALR